ncbi:hypothetical protein ABBQ38_009661 [Trebouxia sp. C0009 RCD-2024]
MDRITGWPLELSPAPEAHETSIQVLLDFPNQRYHQDVERNGQLLSVGAGLLGRG